MTDPLKRLDVALDKAISRAISKSKMTKYMRALAAIIKKRTRLGFGVAKDGASKKKLKGLSSKYIDKRKKSRLSSQTRPGRSNLTFTGQMLDALTGGGEKEGPGVVFLEENRNDDKKNSDIAEWNEDKGRPFLYISKAERKQLEKKVRDDIKKSISKVLTNF